MSKPLGRRHRHVADEILEKAAVIFDEQGYGQAALQDIADAVGIARPSLYHYFRSKEDILSALVDRTTKSREEILQVVRGEEGDALVRLRALLRMVGESVGTNAVGLRLTLNNDGSLPPDVRRRSLRSRRQLFELLVEILADGVDSGSLRPLDEHRGRGDDDRRAQRTSVPRDRGCRDDAATVRRGVRGDARARRRAALEAAGLDARAGAGAPPAGCRAGGAARASGPAGDLSAVPVHAVLFGGILYRAIQYSQRNQRLQTRGTET